MSFEFFTRDFPGKKIEWKKILKGFLWKIEAGFTPALVLHVLYFPLKLSLIVSEEAISPRRRPPPPEPKSERSECLWSEVKWSEVKWKKWWVFGPLNLFNLRYIKEGVRGNNNIGIKKCTTIFLWVLNLGQVGEIFKNFQKHPLGEGFWKKIRKSVILEKKVKGFPWKKWRFFF